MLNSEHFFDLKDIWFAKLLEDQTPWSVLAPGQIERFIEKVIYPNASKFERVGALVMKDQRVDDVEIQAGAYIVGDNIEFKPGVKIEAGSYVAGPSILGKNTIVRHGAYIRGGVISGKGVIIGHTTELKNTLMLNGAKASHFAYIGDSIVGNNVNLGAGTKVSNLKINHSEIILRINGQSVKSNLRKMGAIIGDGTETGCNSVLNPGVLLAKKCMVYPSIAIRNQYYKEGSIIK